MNTSNWWFKFDFRRWRTDTDLRECSLETRGFWLEVLCVMYEKGDYQVTTTIDRWARLIGCTTNEVTRCFRELSDTKTADVTFGNGEVTVLSRRLKRELTSKENNRLRVQKHRGNANVTPMSQDRVISNKKEVREEHINTGDAKATEGDWGYPMQPLIDAFPDVRFTPAAIGFIEAHVKPGDEEAWAKTIDIYRMNYDPMLKRYLPDKPANLLSVFDDQKAKIDKEKNGSTKTNNFGRKRTDQDVFAESADFYANYDEQPIA